MTVGFEIVVNGTGTVSDDVRIFESAAGVFACARATNSRSFGDRGGDVVSRGGLFLSSDDRDASDETLMTREVDVGRTVLGNNLTGGGSQIDRFSQLFEEESVW